MLVSQYAEVGVNGHRTPFGDQGSILLLVSSNGSGGVMTGQGQPYDWGGGLGEANTQIVFNTAERRRGGFYGRWEPTIGDGPISAGHLCTNTTFRAMIETWPRGGTGQSEGHSPLHGERGKGGGMHSVALLYTNMHTMPNTQEEPWAT